MGADNSIRGFKRQILDAAGVYSQAMKKKPQAPPAKANSSVFVGSWIGETQGFDGSPAHLWEISVPSPASPQELLIKNRWEGENFMRTLHGAMAPGELAFRVGRFKAMLVDREHFWIPGWDTNDSRNHEGPDYDVIFSRPGLAELSAKSVWMKVRDSVESSERTSKDVD